MKDALSKYIMTRPRAFKPKMNTDFIMYSPEGYGIEAISYKDLLKSIKEDLED